MFNFTIGKEKLAYSLADSKVTHVITSRKFIDILRSKGVELPSEMGDYFIHIEDIIGSYSLMDMIIMNFTLAKKTARSLPSAPFLFPLFPLSPLPFPLPHIKFSKKGIFESDIIILIQLRAMPVFFLLLGPHRCQRGFL